MHIDVNQAIPRVSISIDRRFSDCKALLLLKKSFDRKIALINFVPAVAAIRKGRAFVGRTGRKGRVGGKSG